MEPAATNGAAVVRASNRNQTLPFFIRGLSSAVNSSAGADEGIAALKAMPHGGGLQMAMLEIREMEIAALSASMKGDHAKAMELMKQATVLEESMGPPSGPPGIIKPSHELFGEILLRAGKPAEAAEMFQTSLLRQPNRARSLLGAARAAKQSGNLPSARSFYARLLDQWKQADEGLPELREAREALK